MRKAIRAAGAKLFFLPPYSPDLNPIEQAFAKMKTLLRKPDARSIDDAWRQIGALLDCFTATECASAGIQDRDGATLALDKIRQRFPWLKLVWANSGYNAHQVKDAVAKSPGLRIQIVKRTDDIRGFVAPPRRSVVERTFSWFGRNRRLAKDYENLADTLAACVTLAAIQFGIRRLARA